MILSLAKYKNLVLAVLLLVLAIPCSVKKEVKIWLDVPVNEHSKPIERKTACSTFNQQDEVAPHQQTVNKLELLRYFQQRRFTKNQTPQTLTTRTKKTFLLICASNTSFFKSLSIRL